MDNIEVEDVSHHDFTTASDWEVFIARLEEIMHQWELPNTKIGPSLKPGDFVNCKWVRTSENVYFADALFTLYHYKLNLEEQEIHSPLDEQDQETVQCHKDALDISNDFARPNGNHLEIACYYGIREFLVLKSSAQSYVMDETKIRILLSSFAIAASNANCDIPALVQVRMNWQKMYVGISVGTGVCTHFDMIHLECIPRHYTYLTGLLALFKEKVGKSCGVKLDPVMVSVKFSYRFDCKAMGYFNIPKLGKLRFGSQLESVFELHLFTTWPKISENVVIDKEGYTDLQPQLAPEWSMQVKLIDNNQTGFLATCLRRFVEFNFSSTSHMFKKENKNVTGPISEKAVSPILSFLFPDPDVNPDALYSDLTTRCLDKGQWKGVKTCAIDSLVWRLTICLANCNTRQEFEGLWYAFVDEIMSRWERDILIPGVSPGPPDCFKTCLLHQKLQMINCCIQKKIAREKLANQCSSTDTDEFESANSDDEEFFECNASPTEEEFETPTKRFQRFHKPKGRFMEHLSMKILATGEPLYIPVMQNPVPKTEDQLVEELEMVIQFGTDQHASEKRAGLMSVSLLSDMEAFKAANPGAVWEDFIRWYSPENCIEDGETDERGQPTGYLSKKVSNPKNPWLETWRKAKPVPIYRQIPLFDDKQEAVKILHFFNTATMHKDIINLFLPTLLHVALYTLMQEDTLSSISNVTLSILKELPHLTNSIPQNTHLYKNIIDKISDAEALVIESNYWQKELGVCSAYKEYTYFFSELMQGKEVKVPGGYAGHIGLQVTRLFNNKWKDDGAERTKFPMDEKPFRKEFILRIVTPRPSPTSIPQLQRLYARINEENIRLAGFFSEDTIFV